LAAPTSRGGVQVVFSNNNWGTQVLGTTPDYMAIREIAIEEGQPFTNTDVDAAARVALLGKTVITNLFNGEDPVGQVIRGCLLAQFAGLQIHRASRDMT
jgi:putative ABC transport system permease protein